jgi:iron complex transport system substrate-binding protein
MLSTELVQTFHRLMADAEAAGESDANAMNLATTQRDGRRIVCLTEEPTETLYLLGEQDRIVGISGFTVRPPRARREKPKVSAFLSAKIDRILALEPDLAIGFSDIQADIAAELIRAGVEVWISNHRSVEGILDYIERLGALVGAADRAQILVGGLRRGWRMHRAARRRPPGAATPGVFRGMGRAAHQRHPVGGGAWSASRAATTSSRSLPPSRWPGTASSPTMIRSSRARRRSCSVPWCGKRFRPEQVAARPTDGPPPASSVPAVRSGDLQARSMSPIILQPGPTSRLTFAVGAALPLLPALLAPSTAVVAAVSITSLVCLGGLGALAGVAGGAKPLVGTIRVMGWGALAMAVTAAAGLLFGAAG